jgi:hypothetical protein
MGFRTPARIPQFMKDLSLISERAEKANKPFWATLWAQFTRLELGAFSGVTKAIAAVAAFALARGAGRVFVASRPTAVQGS